MLLDLCTGVAFPAFPALLGGDRGRRPDDRSVLAAAVRAGGAAGEDAQAVLLPRAVAKWQCPTAKRRCSTSISSIGMVASWAKFAISRSSARPGRRCCAGSVAMRPATCTPSAGRKSAAGRDSAAESGDGPWLIAGFDELSAQVPGSIVVDRASYGSRALEAVVRAG